MDNRRTTNRRIKRLIRLVLSAVVALIGIIAAPSSISAGGSNNPDDLIIIVNKSVKVDRLSLDEVRNYFLMTKVSWPGGEKAIVLNTKDAKLRETFRRKVLSMNAAEEKRFWQDQMIRSGRQEPPQFGNILKAVFSLKGAIGYIYRKDLKGDIVTVALEIPAG